MESTLLECSICMETICQDVNKVLTECGHCFHTKCLMTNIVYNGFVCPYCRGQMAEIPTVDSDDEEDSILYSEISDSESESDDELDYELNNENLILQGVRCLFRRTEQEQEQDQEEEQEEVIRPSIDFIVKQFAERGITMEHLVKSLLIDHNEYEDIEEECLDESDRIFENIKNIIHGYSVQQETNSSIAPNI